MSTLTVLIPPRDASLPPTAWQLGALRYVLADRRGRTVRSGAAPFALLPKAAATILMLAARDVLLIDAVVPPLAMPRLRQALPNIIEDQLLSDGPPPHIAVGPVAAGAGKRAARRTVAAVDRAWLRALHDAFTTAGHRSLRAVPLLACLPMVAPAPAVLAAAVAAADNESAALAETEAQQAAQRAAQAVTVVPDAAQEGFLTADDGADAAAAQEKAQQRAAAHAAEVADAAERAEAHALAASATVLIVDGRRQRDSFQAEIAIRRLPVPPVGGQVPVATERLSGEGLAVPLDALIDTLGALLPGDSVTGGAGRGREIYRLTDAGAMSTSGATPLTPIGIDTVRSTSDTDATRQQRADSAAFDTALACLGIVAKPIDFETLAQAARQSPFDLCQFEFAAQTWRFSPAMLRQARIPLGLLAASVVVAVIGLNVQWIQLSRQRDAIQSTMTALLLDAFPKTTVVLDPAAQMRRSLDTLRVTAGELSPDDFLSLTNGLSMSLGGIPPTAIASLDYDRRVLQLTFGDDVKIDAAFRDRLARNGLDATVEGKRWTIRSSR